MTTRALSTGSYPVAVHDELMSLTFRLVGEYPEIPAGSVMRCLARAVRRALIEGTPAEQIPTRAEHTAHEALARRLVEQGEHARPRTVPSGGAGR